MKLEEIKTKVEGIPHMTVQQAHAITDVIMENKFQNILELGFRHGVSTCYMAGALDTLGGGNIVTIDLQYTRELKPNIESLLGDLGLSKYVTVCYEQTSYIWKLMKLIEENDSPRFDFCYLDGAHDWYTDGFAFFLVDRLLKPGGLIIFDDLDWTYDTSPALKDTPKVLKMPEDEKSTPQIRKVYELLVKQHPSYNKFSEKEGWAFAYKSNEPAIATSNEVKKEIIYQNQYVGLGAALLKIYRMISAKLSK